MAKDLNQQLSDKRAKIKEKRIRGMDFAEKLKKGDSLNDEERSEQDEIIKDIDGLEVECRDIEKSLKLGVYNPDSMDDIGMDDQEKREFSIVKLINARANPTSTSAQEAAKLELEASDAVAEKMSNSRGSIAPQGSFIPNEIYGGAETHRGIVQRRLRALASESRDLNVTTGSAGGFAVATELQSLIEMLRNASALDRAGITVVPGLVGDVSFPKQTGAGTGYWLTPEGAAPTESQQTLGQVNMTPHTMGAYTDYTRNMLLQSSFAVEGFVRSDLSQVLALLLDLAGLYGSGVSGQPVGLDNTANVGSVAHSTNNNPTWAEIVEMRSAIAADNALIGQVASVLESVMVGTLMTTVKDAGSGQFVMGDSGDMLMGRPAIESNQVTDGDIWHGVWSQLILGMWGTLDILVDPYTASTSGTTRVVALQSADYGVRHAESFCKAT